MTSKLYHCVTSKAKGTIQEILSNILSNGLQINDNGETNGIWFSNTPFKNPRTTPLILSLEVTNENIRKFNISDADSTQAIAHKNIPVQFLNVESIAILKTSYGFVHNNDNFMYKMYISKSLSFSDKTFMEWINSYEFNDGLILYKNIMEIYAPEFYQLVDWNNITNPNVKVEIINISPSFKISNIVKETVSKYISTIISDYNS